jgi:hypothetical protein
LRDDAGAEAFALPATVSRATLAFAVPTLIVPNPAGRSLVHNPNSRHFS